MKKFIALLAIVLTSACATSAGELGPGKTGKSFTVSGKTYNQVWNASLAAVKEATGEQSLEVEKNLTVAKEDKEGGRIIANTGMAVWSVGEIVGIFISPAHDSSVYKVEVESRSKVKGALTSNNWEDEIIGLIKKKLNQPVK